MRMRRTAIAIVVSMTALLVAVVLTANHRSGATGVSEHVPDLSIPPTSGNNALPPAKRLTADALEERTLTKTLAPRGGEAGSARSDTSDTLMQASQPRPVAVASPARAGAGAIDSGDLPTIDADKPSPTTTTPGASSRAEAAALTEGGAARNHENGSKPGIAVIPFQLLGPVPESEKDAGVILAEQVLGDTSSRSYALFERTQLTTLLKEQKFEASDLIEKPSIAAKFGQLSGISFLVIGTLSRLDGGYHLSARVVDCQSGQVGLRARLSDRSVHAIGDRISELTSMLGLRDADARPPTPPPTYRPPDRDPPRDNVGQPPLPADPINPVTPPSPQPPPGSPRQPLTIGDLIEATNPAPAFHVSLATVETSPNFVEGQFVHFAIQSDRECYLTLLTVDAAGSITTLLPNGYQATQRARPGELVQIPAPDAPFRLPIVPPFGRAVVKLIATIRPLRLEEVTEKRLRDEKFVQVSADSRAIGVEGDAGRPPVRAPASLDDLFGTEGWSDASLTVNTVARSERPAPSRPPEPVTAEDPNEAVMRRFAELSGAANPQLEAAMLQPRHFELRAAEATELLVIHRPDEGARGIGGTATSRDYRTLLGETEVVPVTPRQPGARDIGGGAVKAQMQKLSSQPGVAAVVPNITVYASGIAQSQFLPVEWGLHNQFSAGHDIGWDQVADLASNITPPLIGLVDQGMNVNDSRVAPIAWTNTGEIPGNAIDDDANGCVDDVHGFNFVQNNTELFDPRSRFNHGTFCAAIIGGRITGSPGDILGVAPHATIIPAVALMPPSDDPNAPARGGYASIRNAVAYAAANGARVINMSLGSQVDQATMEQINRDPLWDALEKRGVIVVCAAGNEATDNDTSPSFPANLPRSNVLSVMAVDAAGRLGRAKGRDGWQVFTNFGPTTVHLAAPGSVILSIPGKDHVALSDGTSFSAPIVTAAIALVWGEHPDWNYKTVLAAVTDTVTPIDDLRGKCVTGGMLNLPAALRWTPPTGR